MGRLIDCDNVYNEIQITSDNFGVAGQVVKDSMHNMLGKIPTVDAIRIPEGATNGDVFKIVFGYEPATDAVVCNKEDWCGASEPCNYCMSNPDSIGKEEEWWNAPYKKEREE